VSNFTTPIKDAFGRYLERFYGQLLADTPAMQEFTARGFSKSAAWAPGRMIDSALEMLDAWRKNDTSQAARATPYLPVMLVAMSKDYIPAPADFSRQLADPVFVTIPSDPKNRVFKMRAAVSEVRAQVVIAAPEEATARSIAMQLQLFSSAMGNRRFYAQYDLAGISEPWPVVFEMPELMAVSVPNDQKNITILAVDFTMRATIPMLEAPKIAGSDGDGQGTNDYSDPDGYLTVLQSDIKAYPAALSATPKAWTVT
jgi:hypothetical protein